MLRALVRGDDAHLGAEPVEEPRPLARAERRRFLDVEHHLDPRVGGVGVLPTGPAAGGEAPAQLGHGDGAGPGDPQHVAVHAGTVPTRTIGGVEVTEVDAVATHDLRRRVLRDGDGRAVVFPQDSDPATFHLAVTDPTGRGGGAGAVLAIVTLTPEPCAARPDRPALHLRGMAVEPARQREGIGRRLLAAAVDRACRDGYAVLWADARDTALRFYGTAGMAAVGDGFVNELGVPHHLVVLDLAPDG